MNEPLLRALCDAPGVSGWEDEVRELARAEMEPHADEVRVDRLGNLVAVRRAARSAGSGPPLKVMVAAHMDEIGFMVKAIDERGFIRVQPVGGFDPRTLVSQRAVIHGRQRVGAAFAPIPNWIESDEERRRVTPLDRLVLDTGLPGDTVRARVEVGDYVTLEARFATLNDEVVVARNFDDRLGVYAARRRLLVDEERRRVTPLDLLVDTARRHEIPYQVTMWGGTDASAMQRTRSGALACTVGVPVRYMHSTVQLAHWDDIEGNVALMRGFLARAHELTPHCR